MINILACLGMPLQSEVCLWSMLGLITTVFDATLFKVNANLKQVWQMKMPEEISLPVQRVLRTMISGVMLVQCFTVYVYLATYIVLLYPVFLEERPTLVLPWLLLAAVRKLLCELTSLALGLGTCVLVGAARPPCVRFVIIKILSIMPSFYMWMLMFNYYHLLKLSSAFKSFATATTSSDDHDDGIELAVRRRRTKSLFDEDALRRSLVQNLYKNPRLGNTSFLSGNTRTKDPSDENLLDLYSTPYSFLAPLSTASNKTFSDTRISEEWIGTEIVLPRASDRVMEQFILMLLQIGAYKQKTGADSNELTDGPPSTSTNHSSNTGCSQLVNAEVDTSPQIENENHIVAEAAYITEFPKIFMKRNSTSSEPCSTRELKSTKTHIETDSNGNMKITHRSVTEFPEKIISIEIERSVQRKKYNQHSMKGKRASKTKSSQNTPNVFKTVEKSVNIQDSGANDTLTNVYTNTNDSMVSTPATTRSEASADFINIDNLRHTDKFATIPEEKIARTESKVHFNTNVRESSKVDTDCSSESSTK